MMAELPTLVGGSQDHQEKGSDLSFYSSISTKTFKIQTNIVAGGLSGGLDLLDTVELNVAGEKTWKFGPPLPFAICGMKGVTVLSKFYLTGESLYLDEMVKS